MKNQCVSQACIPSEPVSSDSNCWIVDWDRDGKLASSGLNMIQSQNCENLAYKENTIDKKHVCGGVFDDSKLASKLCKNNEGSQFKGTK
jgi:hypothetical protein